MPRVLLATALAVLVASPAGAATPSAQQVFQFDGKGFGHGVGMAQVSAQAMALSGLDHEQILSHFYPGTGRARRSATLAVDVWEASAPTGSVTVAVPQGGHVTDGSRSATARPGAVLVVSVDATGYHVREQVTTPARAAAVRAGLVEQSPSPSPSPSSADPVPSGLPTATPSPSVAPPSGSPSPSPSGSPRPTASTTASPTASPTAPPGLVFDSTGSITVVPAAGGLTQVRDTGRSYRGQVQALAREGFRLINLVDLEDYLRGLGEVPKSWRPAALQTQAVAARTYALKATGRGRPLGYDICDDTRCQVYIGAGNEGAATSAAAEATRGEVVTYGGRLATTYYSANAGGRTASPGEGFGGTETSPYLPTNVVAPGDVDPWQVRPTPDAVAARLGYAGRLTGITVTARGPSGRVAKLRLDGSAGAVALTGVAVQRALGLRSNLFTVRLTTGVAEELAAPDSATLQLPPGELAEDLAQPVAPLLPQVATATAREATSRADLPGGLVGLAVALLAGTAGAVITVVVRQGVSLPRPVWPLRR